MESLVFNTQCESVGPLQISIVEYSGNILIQRRQSYCLDIVGVWFRHATRLNHEASREIPAVHA